MNEQELIVDEYDVDDINEPSTEIPTGRIRWHYIKTFLSFFAFVSVGGLILISSYEYSPVNTLFGIMMGLGAICALISIKEIFIIVHNISATLSRIISAISFLTLIPFIPILFAIVFYVGFFGIGLALCVFFPYVPTLISYFRVTIWETVNKKKEIIVALSGILSAVIIFLIVLFIHKSVAVVGSLTIKNDIDRQQLYTEHIADYPEEQVDGIDIDNPTESTYDADNRKQTDVYEFESDVNGAIYDCRATINYSYGDDGWDIFSIDVEKEYKDYTLDVTGTYVGTGEFWGNWSSDNKYTLTINQFTKEKGYGTLNIYCDGIMNETRGFTIAIIESVPSDDDVVLKLQMTFEKPFEYSTFATEETITTMECEYSMRENTFSTTTFDYGQLILQTGNDI